MKRATWLLVVLFAGCAVSSAQTGIKTVVKLLETRYAVRHHGVPALWLAKPFMIGSGIGGLKIAGGQGTLKGKIVRIGHLGYYDETDMYTVVSAFEATLNDLGLSKNFGAGVDALRRSYQSRSVR